MHLPSTHGLKPDCQYLPQVLVQSLAVITPTTNKSSKYRFNRWLYLLMEERLSFLIGLIGLVFVSININEFASRTASD